MAESLGAQGVSEVPHVAIPCNAMAVDQNENRVRDNVRRAIEVMTAWTVDPDKQFTWSRFVQNVTEEPDGAIQMLMGFVTLGGELLVGLEKATGSTAPWHLQQIAAKYA
jgi:hypothetical protein